MRKLDTTWMHPRDQITRIIDKIYWSGLTTTVESFTTVEITVMNGFREHTRM